MQESSKFKQSKTLESANIEPVITTTNDNNQIAVDSTQQSKASEDADKKVKSVSLTFL